MIGCLSGRSGLEIAMPSHQGMYGTCDFMSLKCKTECRLIVTNRQIRTLHFFENNYSERIADTLNREVRSNNLSVVSWFVESGDCSARMTRKILEVMGFLSIYGVIQNGFTRNYLFWKAANKIKNARMVLTREDESQIKDLTAIGPVAIPNYETWRVKIFNQTDIFLCGGGFISICGQGEVEGETINEEDCSICLGRKTGCFSN